MKKLFLGLILVPVLIWLFNPIASFSMVIEGAIQVDMESAEFIAAVEITNIEARKEDRIYTYVTYRPIEVWKGEPDNLPHTIRMLGGKVGDERLIVSDIPQFEIGEKYLLFLRFDNPYCPIIGGHSRTFKIKKDPVGNREKIYSYHDEGIYGVQNDGRVRKKKLSDGDEPMSIEEFRSFVSRNPKMRND